MVFKRSKLIINEDITLDSLLKFTGSLHDKKNVNYVSNKDDIELSNSLSGDDVIKLVYENFKKKVFGKSVYVSVNHKAFFEKKQVKHEFNLKKGYVSDRVISNIRFIGGPVYGEPFEVGTLTYFVENHVL